MKKMNIPFSPPDISQAEIDEVCDALRSGWITTGPRTKELERQVAARCGTPKAVCLNSATAALECALRLLGVGPGDEVITSAYTYTASCSVICHVGATPVLVDVTPDSYQMDLDALAAAITPRTKALIFNNPSNPTGMMYDKEQQEAIARICVEEDLYVISDEIYGKLTFDGKTYTSFASLGEDVKARTILVNGVSKTYAMTGWRIGFAAADQKIIKVMTNYLSHCISGTSSISQAAAVEAFAGSQAEIEDMRATFEERRNYLYERMNKIPGVHAVRSEATFYMMMSMEDLVGKTLYGVEIKDADDFSDVFLDKGGVAVVPCTGFGAPYFTRWSFAVSMETIKEGLDRLERFLAGAGIQ